MEFVQVSSTGVVIHIHCQPGAKVSEIKGLHGDRLKIRLHAPAIEGKANSELIRFLSEILQISRSHIVLLRGDKSREKTVEVRGLSKDEVLSRLGNIEGCP